MEKMEAIDIANNQSKYYSILPDLATGWRPKNLKIAAPIILTFQQNLNHSVYSHYIGYLNKLIYIGPRHQNSYKFHSLTQHGYTIKYGLKYEEVPLKLQRELQEFTMKNSERKGPFQGMNPYLPAQPKFDSNFQSGNLDLVIKVNTNEYNLFLRPDTNTRGHMQWFYFKITNHPRFTSKTIKLNICNNRRSLTLFTRGMKPFIFSKYASTQRGQKWQQGGNNITYSKLSTRECFDKQITNQLTQQQFENQDLEKYHCLSFEYTFETENDEVYFAYCPPFTYTDMKEHLVQVKKKVYYDPTCNLSEEVLCSSMSGLEIPVLTITNSSYPDENKKCVVAMARIHPGQSNGSYVMKGYLQFLISGKAEEMRKKIVFKVIPMINPDGVVFGNYRTGLSGKDLNRKFKAKNEELFPQIIYLKEFIMKLKKESQFKLAYFLDFHGHSVKKNIFTYGPEYDIWTTKYEKAKLFPRIAAAKTAMFRLQSCLFKVATAKKTTARAYMLSMIPYCYTIESSVGLFRSFSQNNNHTFDPSKWADAGFIIGDALMDTLSRIFEEQSRKGRRKKKINQIEKERREAEEAQKQNNERSIKRASSMVSFSRSSSNKSKRSQKKNTEKSKVAISRTALNFQFPQIVEVQQRQEESDGYSQGKSDCESDDNDLSKAKYKNLSGKIMKFIESFNHLVIGNKRSKMRIKSKAQRKSKSGNKNKILNNLTRKNNLEQIKFVPSLKHRLIKREFSEKKITIDEKDRQFIGLQANKISLCRLGIDDKKKNHENV